MLLMPEFKIQVLKPAHENLGGHLSLWTLECKRRERKVCYTKKQNYKTSSHVTSLKMPLSFGMNLV